MPQRLAKIEFVDFGRILCDTDEAFAREWLVTNGLGGYASGTVGGVRNRRYHGMLMAALPTPACRTLLLGDLPTTATYRGRTFALSASRWRDRSISPTGHQSLQRFHIEDGIPVWRWAISDALIERRIFMVHGENTAAIHWTLVQAASPVQLQMGILADCRSHHELGRAGSATPHLERVDRGVRLVWTAAPTPNELFVQCSQCVPTPRGEWWRGYLLDEEAARGFDALDDLWHAADLDLLLTPGESALLTASTTTQPELPADQRLDAERSRVEGLIRASRVNPNWQVACQLVRAADQFVVARPDRPGQSTRDISIIAGYPWFGDWSRDAMISLPGLLLGTGRVDEAKSLLNMFARHLDGGLLPNRFPDRPGDEVEFNAVDAPLLMIIAAARTFECSRDLEWLRALWPALGGIIVAYQRGTCHGIGVDPIDGLVRAGEAGVQLTWMDARVGDRVITPRRGKPIEINAFWFEALVEMSQLAGALGEPGAAYLDAAARVRISFARYWNERRSCCFDVLDGPEGPDASIRPNQLFASALGEALLPLGQRRAICETAMSTLWTPQGLRTLSPQDPRYIGQYSGAPRERDEAYHQGTVWPWLYLPLAKSHWHIHGSTRTIEEFMFPMANHLREAGLGTMSEVFAGDAPHTPGGCIAQAWSVAAMLEIFVWLQAQSAATDLPINATIPHS